MAVLNTGLNLLDIGLATVLPGTAIVRIVALMDVEEAVRIRDATVSLNGYVCTTDIYGSCTIENIEPSSYILVVSHPDYLPLEIPITLAPDDVRSFGLHLSPTEPPVEETYIAVQSTRNADTGEFVRDLTAEIDGYHFDGPAGAYGQFSIEVEPGTYTITVSANGYETAVVANVSVSYGEQRMVPVIYMTPTVEAPPGNCPVEILDVDFSWCRRTFEPRTCIIDGVEHQFYTWVFTPVPLSEGGQWGIMVKYQIHDTPALEWMQTRICQYQHYGSPDGPMSDFRLGVFVGLWDSPDAIYPLASFKMETVYGQDLCPGIYEAFVPFYPAMYNWLTGQAYAHYQSLTTEYACIQVGIARLCDMPDRWWQGGGRSIVYKSYDSHKFATFMEMPGIDHYCWVECIGQCPPNAEYWAAEGWDKLPDCYLDVPIWEIGEPDWVYAQGRWPTWWEDWTEV